jgi:hypothetical protein
VISPIQTALLLVFLVSTPAAGQQIGVPTQVDLPNGQGTLALDFTSSDYQLILYSGVRNESDSTRAYTFTLGGSFPSAKPTVHLASPKTSLTASNKAVLRKRETELTQRLQRNRPRSTKQAVAFQVGSTRTFVFDSFGDVPTQNVTATLAATSSRAEAWIDNATTTITAAQVQAQIDQFSTQTYPTVTSVFGAPSDVDSDSKVLFLYTKLVDQVGGVAGFYSAQSLFSASQGGDGNEADMMFIGVDHEADFFESLLAHEFQHLINYNQHVLVNNGSDEIASLNEAMSHVAEDLVNQHVQGGNPGNVATYAKSPSVYSLLAESAHDSGVRGTAYTFARSMMESFGDNVPSQLVQTNASGISNVEAVSGQTFEDVYETYLSRMFLAGSGLNSAYDFSYPFFTDSVSGSRSILVPAETAVSPEAVTISGTTKAFASSSIRLMGTGQSTISIDAESAGAFRGVLIPIPRDFRHNVALKADYFAGITFDGPITGNFTTGQNVRLAGTTITSDVVILARFDPLFAGQDTLQFRSTITNGAFAINVLFPHGAAGDYEMSFFSGQDDSLPFVGRIPVATVEAGSGGIELPADFFTGVTLSAPLSTELASGESLRLSGTVADPAATTLLLSFTPAAGGADVEFSFPVSGGSFEEIVLFSTEQEGDYLLQIFAGQSGQTLPFVGKYPTFTVSAGSGAFSLPVDFFTGLTLSAPLPTQIDPGDAISLSGTTTDPSVSVVLFQFTSSTQVLSFQVDVVQNTFDKGVVFFPAQAGDYELDVFAGSGSSLPHVGQFTPLTVSSGSGAPIFLPPNAFSGLTLTESLSSEFYQGQSQTLTGTLADVGVSQVAIRLDAQDGTPGPSEFAEVSGGSLQVPIPTDGLSPGTYSIVIFAGQSGQSLPFLDSFGPVQILASQARLVLTSASVSFPGTEIGQTSTQVFTFSNTGSETLTFSSSTLSSDAFTVTALPTPTSGSGSGSITIQYQPVSEGTATGVLVLETNDPTQPTISVQLTGTGTPAVPIAAPEISLSETTLSWPTIEIGASSTQSLVIKNTGTADLEISTLTAEGSFELLNTVSTIAAGDSTVVDIVFVGSEAGIFTGSLTIVTNTELATQSIPLSVTVVSEVPSDTSLVGDFDGNNSVDFSDFLTFAAAFGATSSDPKYLANVDLDASGAIDFTDFLTFAAQFGKSL